MVVKKKIAKKTAVKKVTKKTPIKRTVKAAAKKTTTKKTSIPKRQIIYNIRSQSIRVGIHRAKCMQQAI